MIDNISVTDEAKGEDVTSADSTMAYEDEDVDCMILEPKPRLLKPSISIGSSSWEVPDVQLDDESLSGHEGLPTGVSSSGHEGLPKGVRPILQKAPKKKPAGKHFTLPIGWTRVSKTRLKGNSKGHQDTYYRSPGGKLLRSLVEVRNLINKAK